MFIILFDCKNNTTQIYNKHVGEFSRYSYCCICGNVLDIITDNFLKVTYSYVMSIDNAMAKLYIKQFPFQ